MTPNPRIPDRTRSYDDVAGIYERTNAPRMFDAPAAVLAALTTPPGAARVLDVGAGTGAVTRAVTQRLAGGGTVVAVDPSLAMLAAARRGGAGSVAAGALPHLPFADGSFDAALAAFVITHVDDPEAAVRDVRRVLRPGGVIGLSAWGAGSDACVEAWMRVAHEFVPEETLGSAITQMLPGEALFSRARGLASLLAATGYESVREETRAMAFAMTPAEYLEAREAGAAGRTLRFLLDDASWARWRSRAKETMDSCFPNGIAYVRDVHFAVAIRPEIRSRAQK